MRRRIQAALAVVRAVLSELNYAQNRMLEIRTGLTLTPETARRLERAQISTLNALYDWHPLGVELETGDPIGSNPLEDAWPSVS